MNTDMLITVVVFLALVGGGWYALYRIEKHFDKEDDHVE